MLLEKLCDLIQYIEFNEDNDIDIDYIFGELIELKNIMLELDKKEEYNSLELFIKEFTEC